MPAITDFPPVNVRADLDTLSTQLNLEIPAKTNDNLLIATWNIRSFASLTREWTATSQSPKRDLRGLRAIIEILSRFDVIAIQELKGNLRALRDTIRFLGQDWGFLMTDISAGDAGNNERLAFIFDRTRVKPSGLASELVVPPERLDRIGVNALSQQFARTPYAVSFQRENTTFILVTLHVLWGGEDAAVRVPELQEIADWMRDWAQRSNRYHHNLLVLGDFNIDRAGSALYNAFVSTGLTVAEGLDDLPRTIFDDVGDSDDDNFYDQIAWFTSGSAALIDLNLRAAGNFDFQPYVYTDTSLSRTSISYRVSDHLPLWVEFGL